MSGGAGLLVGHPLDTIKVRMQTMNYGGIYHVLKSTFRNESVTFELYFIRKLLLMISFFKKCYNMQSGAYSLLKYLKKIRLLLMKNS